MSSSVRSTAVRSRPPRTRTAHVGALVALVAGGVLAAISMSSSTETAGGVWIAALGAVLTAAGLTGLAVERYGVRLALTSPVAIVAVLVICLFGIRPAALVIDPGTAIPGLYRLGFSWQDLARAAGFGTLGFALFGAAFFIAWRPVRTPQRRAAALPDDRRLTRGLAGSLAFGSVLWGISFFQAGGFNALINDPVSLHLGQFGAGYGSLGFAICLGTFLVALWAWLQRPAAGLGRLPLIAGVICVIAAILLQTRGPLIATVLAAVAIVLSQRTFRPRVILAVSAVALLLLYGLFFLRTVRDYAQTDSVGSSLELAAKTSPVTMPSLDFTELDALIALDQLVPEALPSLGGESILNVPGTFLPRKVWKGKPFPIDLTLARKLYGKDSEAGSPFTLAGELLWNFGRAGALVGMVLVGILAGLLWRFLLVRGAGVLYLGAALLFGYSYLILTRPLGPMLLTTAFGFFGVALAAGAMGVLDPQAIARQLAGRRARPAQERV